MYNQRRPSTSSNQQAASALEHPHHSQAQQQHHHHHHQQQFVNPFAQNMAAYIPYQPEQQHQFSPPGPSRDTNMQESPVMMHRRNHSLGGSPGAGNQGAAGQSGAANGSSAQRHNSQQSGQASGGHSGQAQRTSSSSSYNRNQEPMPIAAPALTQPSTHTVKASSTTSEFTKRKNWSQHIIDEIQDFMHVLSPSGNFIFVTPSVQELAGWAVEDLVGRPISDFVHPDDVDGYREDFQQSLQEGKDLTVYCRFRTKDDRYVLFEMTGHPYYAEAGGQQNVKCFFGMGRPYPSKNQAMLDSFLELKFENERLRQELQTLYKDIEGQSGGDELLKSLSGRSEGGVIDPVTGLVQANGLLPSSSNTYGALGIGISSNATAKSEGTEKKKKKPRVEEGEFVCRDCGTVDSPEWRKGPEGPKSLCNACGLRYAKLTSKAAKAAKDKK